MRTTSTTAPKPTTRRQIRIAAICGAIYFGICCSAISAFQGASPLRAIFAGIASFLIGMGTWTVYHIASGRNDGLVISAAGIMPAQAFFSTPGSLGAGAAVFCLALLTLGFLVPCAWFAGRYVRASAAKAAKACPSSPLYDAEID